MRSLYKYFVYIIFLCFCSATALAQPLVIDSIYKYSLQTIYHRDYLGTDSIFFNRVKYLDSVLTDYVKNHGPITKEYILSRSELATMLSMHDVPRAIKILQDNIVLAEKRNYFSVSDLSRHQLGNIYQAQNQLNLALEEYLITSAKFKKRGDWVAYGYSLVDIGNVYFATEIYSKAIQYYHQSFKIFETKSTGNKLLIGFSVVYQNLGLTYQKKKNYDSAYFFLQKSLEARIQSNQTINTSLTLAQIANLFDQQDKNDSANYYYQKSVNHALSNNENERLTTTLVHFAHFKRKDGDLKKASQLAHQALGIALRHDYISAIALIANELGEIYFLLQDVEKAKYYLNLAVENARSRSDFLMEETALQNLLQLYEERGEYEKAFLVSKSLLQIKNHFIKNNETRFQLQLEMKARERDSLLSKDRELQKDKINILLLFTLVISVIFLVYLYIQRRRMKKGKQELQNTVNQLEFLKRHQDQIYSLIAHDLKGPIGSVIALLDLMIEEPDLQEDEKFDFQKSIHQSLQDVYLLMLNLVSWASIEQVRELYNPKPVLINELIALNMRMLKRISDAKEIVINTHIENDCQVITDENMVSAIFRNLISNAIKFSNEKSTVNLRVHCLNAQLMIEIEDQGIGMSKQLIDQILNHQEISSRRGTNNEKGNGLGIRMVLQFIDLMKGSYQLESKEGHGTRWIISIPFQAN